MGRALAAYLYVPYAPCATPPAGTLRTISVSHPLIPLGAPLPSLAPSLCAPRDATDTRARCQSAGFSRWARYRCVRRGAGLICEAFAGTSRPRIIIKIPHRCPLPAVPLAAARRRPPSVILHSIPSWINPLMAGSLICAPLQNNRELHRRARRGSVTRREVYYS